MLTMLTMFYDVENVDNDSNWPPNVVELVYNLAPSGKGKNVELFSPNKKCYRPF